MSITEFFGLVGVLLTGIVTGYLIINMLVKSVIWFDDLDIPDWMKMVLLAFLLAVAISILYEVYMGLQTGHYPVQVQA